MNTKILGLFVSTLLTGCAFSVHNVYVSGFEPYTPQASGKMVAAHAEQFVFLGFKGDTDYLNAAYEDLQEQCPKGDIVGIVTEHQTAMGFLSWKNHIYMKGLCTGKAKTRG